MPLMEHLRELRTRIFKSILAVCVGAVIGWIFYDADLRRHHRTRSSRWPTSQRTEGLDIELVLSGVTQAFVLQLKVAVFAGVVLVLASLDLPAVGLHHPRAAQA